MEQELLQRLADHRPAPHHRLAGVDQKADGHHLDAIAVAHGDEFAVLLRGAGFGNAEHGRLAGAVKVGIEHADAGAHALQRASQIGGGGRFADAALARSHGDNVFHAFDGGDALLHFVGDDAAADFHIGFAADGIANRLPQSGGQMLRGKTEFELHIRPAGAHFGGGHCFFAAQGAAGIAQRHRGQVLLPSIHSVFLMCACKPCRAGRQA